MRFVWKASEEGKSHFCRYFMRRGPSKAIAENQNRKIPLGVGPNRREEIYIYVHHMYV